MIAARSRVRRAVAPVEPGLLARGASARGFAPPLASLTAVPARPAVQRLCAACAGEEEMPVQARLEVGATDDRHEREADAIAAQLTGEAGPAVPSVQRRGEGGGGGETIAASHGELASGGAPLPATTRDYFEARMDRDLGGVRVHEGAGAAALNASIQARAFTYRNHVWLGPRERPGPSFTMAHELAHVAQQTAPGPIAPAVQRAPGDEPAAAGAAAGDAAGATAQTGGGGMGDVRIAEDIAESKAAEAKRREGQTEGADMSRRMLTDADIGAIQGAVAGSAPPARVTPVIQGANFVLHDTGSLSSVAHLKEVAGKGRRSSGAGAAAYAPQSGGEIMAHSPFFGARRPTATQWEKGTDILSQADRQKAFRKIWKAAARDVRESAVESVLIAQGSPPKELKKELKAAIKELNGTGEIHSAGTWGIQNLCGMVNPTSVVNLADSPASEADLTDGCTAVAGLFAIRDARIGATVNMEIAQEAGSACRTTAKKGKPLVPLTPYSADQYTAVRDVYLKAALEARIFPAITTHFLVDKVAGDHCDPRCFDLGRLYGEIQTLLGHVKGSTYGIAPVYGTGAGDNVWWNDTVCGGGHP